MVPGEHPSRITVPPASEPSSWILSHWCTLEEFTEALHVQLPAKSPRAVMMLADTKDKLAQIEVFLEGIHTLG
jgi:hypothetical protein